MSNVSVGINLTLLGQSQVVSGMRGVTTEFEQAGNRAASSFSKTRAGLESISTQLQSLQNYAKAWIGASQLIGLTSSIVKIADEYIGLQSRLKLATTSQLEFNTANAALFAIAQQNGVPLKESLSLYSKLAPALRELGGTQAQTLTMTDLVGKSLRLSGAGAAESASTMLQLSQALGSGVLRGDEFNSMMENSPRLMKAVADGLGKPIGELRKMAEEGKLTADVVVNSLLSQKQKLESEYSSLPLTVSAAWTKMGNAVTQEIGRLDKESGGATGRLALVLGSLADNLKAVEGAMVTAAQVGAGVFVASLVAVRAAAIEAAGLAGLGMLRNALAGIMLLYSSGGIAAVASGILGIGTASAAATPAAMTLSGIINSIVWPAAIAYGLYEFGKYAFETFKSVRLYVTEFVSTAQRAAVALAHPIDALQNNAAHQARIKEINDTAAAVWAMENAQQAVVAVKKEDAKLTPGKNDATDKAAKKAADAELKRYTDLIQSSNDRIAALKAEASGSDKLTASEKALAIFEAQMKDGKTGLIGQHIDSIHAILQEVSVTEQSTLAHAAELKAREDMLKGLESETTSIKKQIEAAIYETSIIGKTKEEIVLLQSQRADHTITVMEERLAVLDAAGACTAESQALTDQIKVRRELKSVLENKAAQTATQAAVDLEKKANVDMWKTIESTAHSTWNTVWQGGNDAFTNIGKTLKSAVLDLLYQMTFKKWIIGVTATATGGAATAADLASGGSGGSSVMDALSSANSASGGSMWLSNFSEAAQLQAGKVGALLANNGATQMGSWMIDNAATIGKAADIVGSGMSYVSAIVSMRDGQWGKGIGTAVGTYFGGPIGGMIGSTIGGFVDSLFGGGSSPSAVSMGRTANLYSSTGSMQSSAGAQSAMSDSYVQGMQTQYAATIKALGGSMVQTAFEFGAGKLSDNSQQWMAIGSAAGSSSYSSGQVNTLSTEAIQLEASRAVFAAVKGSTLPGYLSKLFDGLTAGAMTQQQIADTLTYAQSVKNMRDALTETRTPMEITRQNIVEATAAFSTSAATFKTDFIAAIDKGISPQTLTAWQQLGSAIDQLAAADAQAAAAAAQAAAAAAQAVAQAATKGVADSFAALKRATDAQRTSITSAYNTSLASVNASINTVNASISKLADLSNALKSTISTLNPLSRVEAQAQIQAALVIARAGGVLPDAASLRGALDVLSKPTDGMFSTLQEQQRDQRITNNSLADLSAVTDHQLTVEQTTLGALNAQLVSLNNGFAAEQARLDGILTGAQSQIDVLNNINTSVLSLADALSQFGSAIRQPGTGAANAYTSVTSTQIKDFISTNGLTTASQMYSAAVANNVDPYAVGAAYGLSKSQTDTALTGVTRVPGFADGGLHSGGWRVVGERGPELEYTGPAKIVNNSDTRSIFNVQPLLDEIAMLRAELKAGHIAIAQNTGDMNKTLRRWNGDGMPEVRVLA